MFYSWNPFILVFNLITFLVSYYFASWTEHLKTCKDNEFAMLALRATKIIYILSIIYVIILTTLAVGGYFHLGLGFVLAYMIMFSYCVGTHYFTDCMINTAFEFYYHNQTNKLS